MDNFWYYLLKIRFKIISFIKNKEKIFYKKEALKICKEYELPLKVNGPTILTKNTYLGKNVNFNGLKIRGKGVVKIGDNFHSGTDCNFLTSFHNFNNGNKIPYDETTIDKDIIIGDNVWIGNNVIILGGVTIGDGVIIQAGSVVVNDIPKFSIAGGHPAKVFSKRDENHYNELLKEKKFH
jgi:acetyltransferase-like isoleucine patch superfamily enzyme